MQNTFQTRVLSPAAGVDVLGLDLRRGLAPHHEAELRRLLDEHQLLLFRGQEIDAGDQIRVMGAFGPVSDEKAEGTFHSFVSNVRPDGLFAEWALPFHSDFAFNAYLPPIFSLYGFEVEGPSVPTLFANCVRAVRELPPALRSRVEGRKLVNADDFTKDARSGKDRRTRLLDLPEMPPVSTHPRVTEPVLKPHPRTGVPLLSATEMNTSHIEGMESAASEGLVQELFARLYAPDNIYSHHWNRGDLVIWDNVALQHGRKFLGGSAARRTLRRVVVSEKSVKELFGGSAYHRPGGWASQRTPQS